MTKRSGNPRPANRLAAKVQGAQGLLRGPDRQMMARIELAIARERAIYLRQMAKDLDSLLQILADAGRPSALWPLAHELRCMAGTYGYAFLSDVAQILCQLICPGGEDQPLPPDVAEVFAAALTRGRVITGPYGAEDETVLAGLRKVAKRHSSQRASSSTATH